MKKFFLLPAVLCAISLLATPETFRPKIQIAKVDNFDLANGIDNPAWKNAPAYELMTLVRSPQDMYRRPQEPATVQYLYDDQYLYIRTELIDSDIMTQGTQNGSHLYRDGDLVEIFIKPANAHYYWEIYGAPNQLNTRFYFNARGSVGLPSSFRHVDVGIKVFSRIDGTYNDPSDRDRSYIVLIAIPTAELNRPHQTGDHPAGTVPFAPGEDWRIQTARYNYSRYLDDLELSSFPQTYGGYHSLEYFAEIELIK